MKLVTAITNSIDDSIKKYVSYFLEKEITDMVKDNTDFPPITIPDGFIVFISGVPGVGKTTISYELFRRCDKFRIIEETDIIREILLGYNDYLKNEFGDKIDFMLKKINITDHTKLLTLNEAKEQCIYMKSSLEQIVARQQRKGIATIINGVHIIPEVLNGIADNKNVVYINLYVTSANQIYNRISHRNPSSYMLEYIPLIFQTNFDLYVNTQKIASNTPYIFNINATKLTIEDTIEKIVSCLTDFIANSH